MFIVVVFPQYLQINTRTVFSCFKTYYDRVLPSPCILFINCPSVSFGVFHITSVDEVSFNVHRSSGKNLRHLLNGKFNFIIKLAGFCDRLLCIIEISGLGDTVI